MGFARRAGLASVLAAVLFWSLASPLLAQGPADRMSIATDYQLMGTSPLTGGGHVTWTLTGAVAQELRGKILHLFDEYVQIPRGFTYAEQATGRSGDGRIGLTEGLAYTGLVENELEGTRRGLSGTPMAYFLVDRTDLIDDDPQDGLNRSTSGLLNTDLNTTQDLQIRFLFNAATTTEDAVVPLATRAYADALHTIFSFEQRMSSTLTASGGYNASWPFLEEEGWHVTTVDGIPALGLWDETTQTYLPAMNVSTRSFMDRVLAPATPGFDLRFASSVGVSFLYTGEVGDAGDRLFLEVATGPSFSTWEPLSIGGSPTLPPTAALGTWSNVSVDLSAYLGQQVRLRFRFESNVGLEGPGFFIRDFAIVGPSIYTGEIAVSDAHYLIGTLSFSEPAVVSGSFQSIRTPGGEILWYSTTWPTGAPPGDTIRFRTFDALENPQILFGIMLVAAYAVSRAQEAAYDRYRAAHPSVYHAAVRKAKWIHRLGKVGIAFLLLLYFVPAAFFVIGVRLFVGGLMYVFLAAALTVSLGLGARAVYRRRLRKSPPPAAPTGPEMLPICPKCVKEIPSVDVTYTCECGVVYHLRCAATVTQCANCARPISVEIVRKQRTVSVRCVACGEPTSILDGTDPRAVICPSCGAYVRPLDVGKRYLVQAASPAVPFAWVRDLSRGGAPSLCLTPSAPEKLFLEFGVRDAKILRVSSTVQGGVDPKRLDPVGLKAILPLARAGKGGVILYDGLDQMILQSSLGEMLRFLRKANDMAFVHGITVIGRVGPGVLSDDELRRVRSEFDEMMDLSTQV